MEKRKAPSKATASKVEPADEWDDDWEEMTVAQLKKELTSRKMDTTGRKADLIRRLREDEQSTSEAGKFCGINLMTINSRNKIF